MFEGGGEHRLNIIHLNIHSLQAKLDDLYLLLQKAKQQDCELDVILLCETFLNDNNVGLCSIPGYKLIDMHQHNSARGGACIFIDNKLSFSDRTDLSIFHEGKFESCFVELNSNATNSKNILIGEIYRVPGTSETDFLTEYGNLINKLISENKEIILGMDQYLDYLKINSHRNTTEFLELNLSNNLIPTIIRPTRITLRQR